MHISLDLTLPVGTLTSSSTDLGRCESRASTLTRLLLTLASVLEGNWENGESNKPSKLMEPLLTPTPHCLQRQLCCSTHASGTCWMLQCMSASLWWLNPLHLVPSSLCSGPVASVFSTTYLLPSKVHRIHLFLSFLFPFTFIVSFLILDSLFAGIRSKQRHIDIFNLPCLTRSRHSSSFPTFSGVGIPWIIPQHELKLALYLHVIPIHTFNINVMHAQTPAVFSRSGVLRSCLHGSWVTFQAS